MTTQLMTEHIEKWHPHKPPTYRFTLCLRDWRRQVPQDVRNLIFSEAVNFCIEAKILEVVGYLMSSTKIRVILDRKNSEVLHGLELFTSLVEDALTRYHFSQQESATVDPLSMPKYTKNKLFKVAHFNNYLLARLITGRRVNRPYEDPYITRLKRYIKYRNFCSVVDYSGAIGPVSVVVKPPKYFKN